MALHGMPAERHRLATVTVGWAIAGAALGATALVLTLLLPPQLVLFATGSVLATAGFAAAAALLVAGRRMRHGATVGWDAAAGLVFLGVAAALLADTGEALAVLAELRAR